MVDILCERRSKFIELGMLRLCYWINHTLDRCVYHVVKQVPYHSLNRNKCLDRFRDQFINWLYRFQAQRFHLGIKRWLHNSCEHRLHGLANKDLCIVYDLGQGGSVCFIRGLLV